MRGAETDVIRAVVVRLAANLSGTLSTPTYWPEGSSSNQPAVITWTDTWRDADGTLHTAEPRQLPVFVGRKFLDGGEYAPPRLVLYLARDPVRGSASPAVERQSLPRTLEYRLPQLTIQCWGADYGEAGALYQAFRNAIHDTATTPASQFQYESLDGEWEIEGAAGAWTAAGEALYHAFAIQIPVVSPTPPTTHQGPPLLTEKIE